MTRTGDRDRVARPVPRSWSAEDAPVCRASSPAACDPYLHLAWLPRRRAAAAARRRDRLRTPRRGADGAGRARPAGRMSVCGRRRCLLTGRANGSSPFTSGVSRGGFAGFDVGRRTTLRAACCRATTGGAHRSTSAVTCVRRSSTRSICGRLRRRGAGDARPAARRAGVTRTARPTICITTEPTGYCTTSSWSGGSRRAGIRSGRSVRAPTLCFRTRDDVRHGRQSRPAACGSRTR